MNIKSVFISMIFATAMLADSVTLTAVNGTSEDGFSVSPYSLSIDGGAVIDAWCVDFLDHATVGETWQATITDDIGTYFPSLDYPAMLGIIQAELNDPNPDLIGYQNALWGIEDPADFGPPSGVYLADESTLLTASFQVIDGIDPSDPNRPQEFIVDSPAPEPTTIALLCIALGFGCLCWFFNGNIQEWWKERFRPFESTNARMRRVFPELGDKR